MSSQLSTVCVTRCSRARTDEKVGLRERKNEACSRAIYG